MRDWCLVIAIAAACGSKTEQQAPPAQRQPVAMTVANGSDAGAAKPHDKPAPITKQQRADYKKHVKAGYALQKQKKWAEAVVELEAALAAIPNDQRAEAELGYSAMNAGDFAKARKADEQAVREAVDKKVEAAARFNLGTVLERSGDKDGALKQYLASLQLRPNKTVEQAVGRLGAKPDQARPFCAPGKALCDCIALDAFGWADAQDKPDCKEVSDPKPPVSGWHVYHAEFYRSSADYLFDDKLQYVAVIGSDDSHHRHEDSTDVVKAEVRTVGAHKVLWLETKHYESSTNPRFDGDDEVDELDEDKTTTLTLCVLGDGKVATTCPLRVPLVQSHDHTEMGMSVDPSAPVKPGDQSETNVEVTLADDGTATVKLVSGASDDALAKLVGPHKLW
jgi:hypothetical protein